MAFDGITVAAIVRELRSTIENGRISKIAQPEADELLLTIKTPSGQQRLFLSADASLPLAYLASSNKPSPLAAPNFCMLLRKHIGSGRITAVTQPGLERVICLEIEHLNELKDPCRKRLMVELMGKHSNIIFCDEDGTILDSIKHVSAHMSSVREVLPGRPYFIPATQEKQDPLTVPRDVFLREIFSKPVRLAKAIYTTLTGFSPLMAEEVCFRASLDSDRPATAFTENEQLHLYGIFSLLREDLLEGSFAPAIYYDGEAPVDFSAVPLRQFQDLRADSYQSISKLLEDYYAKRNALTRIRQKSSDLRHLVQTALERSRKKYDLQLSQMKDTEKRDKYRVYGELINTYGYSLPAGARQLTAVSYYTGEEVSIPLDGTLTPAENAQRYFSRYNKLKRTYEALETLIKETEAETAHLGSVMNSLEIARGEEDLAQIREELVQSGYIRRKSGEKRARITAKPLHYISSDGFHIYVGKNNLQNEELTFQFADGGDWWFHAKGAPGSHVIVKSQGRELPDRTFEEAAALAAHYSALRDSGKAEVDYVQRKHVKKPGGAKPGFVVYYTNYSMAISTDIRGIAEAP